MQCPLWNICQKGLKTLYESQRSSAQKTSCLEYEILTGWQIIRVPARNYTSNTDGSHWGQTQTHKWDGVHSWHNPDKAIRVSAARGKLCVTTCPSLHLPPLLTCGRKCEVRTHEICVNQQRDSNMGSLQVAEVWTRQHHQPRRQTCWHKIAPLWNWKGTVFKSQMQKRFNLKRDTNQHITHVYALKPVLWLAGFVGVITVSFPMHKLNRCYRNRDTDTTTFCLSDTELSIVLSWLS